MKIGLLSDTHSHMDERILKHLEKCDEIWHAGDIGTLEVTDQLKEVAPLVAVYGNIDSAIVRQEFPKDHVFEREGAKIWMTHIGGYPPKYKPGIISQLGEIKPQFFICGHSHILKVINDPKRSMLHINPGAAGQHGFHKMRTMVTFELNRQRPSDFQVIELGKRGQ